MAAAMSSADEERWLAQERDYRRQVNKAYYRREEDFQDLNAYNDYLEEVEEIIEGLVNEKTRPAARARLDKLRAADPALTARNRALFDEDRVALSVAVEREKREAQQRAQQRLQQAQSQAEEQARVKAALEDEVAGGKSVTEAQAELLRRKPPPPKPASIPAAVQHVTNQGYSYAPTSLAQVRCTPSPQSTEYAHAHPQQRTHTRHTAAPCHPSPITQHTSTRHCLERTVARVCVRASDHSPPLPRPYCRRHMRGSLVPSPCTNKRRRRPSSFSRRSCSPAKRTRTCRRSWRRCAALVGIGLRRARRGISRRPLI
jgi:CDK-activating kinase assembly factor MAT1